MRSTVPERRSVTRREFLATAVAVSLSLTILPRIGRAQDGAGEAVTPEAFVRPLGAKGAGEIGITGAAAAICNAVFHVTGKRVRGLPITLDKIV